MEWCRLLLYATTLAGSLAVFPGFDKPNPVPDNLSPAVVIRQQEMDTLHDQLTAKITSVRTQKMTKPGLVGAMGGTRLKLLKSGTHQVLLPLPQMTDSQVPLCYYIRSTPRDSAVEYRIQRREELNDIVNETLQGEQNQEIQLEWSSVILISAQTVSSDTDPDKYLYATACVQSDSARIRELADRLWPENGKVEEYARNIQQFICQMKYVKQPASLDAITILDSGMNGICTANANLALGLMRAKGIGCRSMAVIPPTSQRLEMHRIVEYYSSDQWHYFDPSSLHIDIPMKPWQTMIMAKTSLEDENLAMTPRMGSMPGCPYAQELELLSTTITLWGQDFFWTTARPLTEFDVHDDTLSLAKDAWNRYLQEGMLNQGQIEAASITTSPELSEALKDNNGESL